MTAPAETLVALRHRRHSREVERATELLGLCLRAGGIANGARAATLLEATSPELVLALARFHGVSGLIHASLSTLPDVAEVLIRGSKADFDAAVHRHLLSTWELSQLKPVLDATNVPWAVLKGPAVVELLYGAHGGRSYQDLDLLVDPAGFSAVLVALETGGRRQLDRNWAVLRREMRGEVHYRGDSRVEIDLHWNLVNMYRGRIRIDSRELLERAERVTLAGVEVATLDRADALIHLCLHAAISGGDRILWLKDIERAVAVRPPEWDVVVDRCRGWNVAAPVGLMLRRAHRFLGAPVPAAITRTLLPPAARRLVRMVDRLSPWERALGRLTSPSRLLARSIGQGPLGASLWLAVRSIRNLDPGQEQAASAFTPGGDERDRAAFIEAVVRGER